jgi:hypothetical protein
MKKFYLKFALVILLFLIGCETPATSPVEQIPSPEPGKSTVLGTLVTPEQTPLNDVVVRLAEVYRFGDEQGTFILDEAQSPSTISQEDGQYIFLNISPGEYVLFVGRLHAEYKVVSEADEIPIIYEVGPGEILEIEPVIIDFN